MYLFGLVSPEAHRGARRARVWFEANFHGREIDSVELVARSREAQVFRLYFQRFSVRTVPTPYIVIVVSRTSDQVTQSQDPRYFRRNYM